ncbi:MAG: T9SS type A sorting domain-containing protein [Paludibacteraceae bacterium]|nr:T9SS type A sorting domain-containing protein [Paludibacteraceae bacterium]
MRYLKQFVFTATQILIGSISFAQDNQFVSGQIAGHDYVDLGLPDGTLWATYNVGATKPEEYGDYFAWGETETKEDYSWSTYKWTKDDGKTFTKYTSANKKLVLDAEDDAVTAKWGSEWRMPTETDLNKLKEVCTWEWTKNFNGSGVEGLVGISKNNGATIFLPKAGSYYENSYVIGFNYWLSSFSDFFDKPLAFAYYNGSVITSLTDRFVGNPVRAVATKAKEIEKYVVSFYTMDSVLIGSQIVDEWKSAKAPVAPSLEGYRFVGWSDSTFTKVSKDINVYAQYNNIRVSGQVAGYDYVDLGLPSGIKWATYNVGATNPAESGDSFAWGETESKEKYSWETYKWDTLDAEGNYHITKYITSNSYGTIDYKLQLDEEDDAASVNWGPDWRSPRAKELIELYSGCSWSWTRDYANTGVAGRIGTSLTNGNQIFLPEAYYSQSELDTTHNDVVNVFSNKSYSQFLYLYRCSNMKIRAVSGLKTYSVIFYGEGGIIETQYVEAGKSATPVSVPNVKGYEFIGWTDSSFVNVTKDMYTRAIYRKLPANYEPTISGVIGKYTYVDLGLPSGIKWATYNVGATKPTETGDYFAWGETKPKKDYSWATYKWCNGNFYNMTKYCIDGSYGTLDNKSILEPEDDAASKNWGSDWRMPTREETIELVDRCSWKWYDDYNGTGVSGYLGTSEETDANIFLPVTGRYNGNVLEEADSYGYYWSSEVSSGTTYYSNDFYIYDFRPQYWDHVRYLGQCVRAVSMREPTGVSTTANDALLLYTDNGTIHIANAQQHAMIQIFDMNGKEVKSAVADGNGNAEITASKGVYVVSDGNQSTKVIVK